tara:strand:+ start:99 stop:518 length:420 start_codon:yes stop_codon:yes gene_type:complete
MIRTKKSRRLEHLKKWLMTYFKEYRVKFYIAGELEASDFTVDYADCHVEEWIDDWKDAYLALEAEVYDRYVGRHQCFWADVHVCNSDGFPHQIEFDTDYMHYDFKHGSIHDVHDDEVDKQEIHNKIFDEVVENYISYIF